MQARAKVCLVSVVLITLAGCAGEAVDEGRKPPPRTMAAGGNSGYAPYGFGGSAPFGKGGTSAAGAGSGGQGFGAGAGGAGAPSIGTAGTSAGGATGSGGSSGSGSSPKAGAANTGPTDTCPSLTLARLPNGACTDRVREYDIGAMSPTSIVLGSDNRIWVDDDTGNQIIQLDGDGRPNLRVKCDEGSSTRALAGGRGDAIIWYTDEKAQTLVKVSKGLQKEVTPLAFKATAIALGTNNDLFLTELGKAIYLVQPNQPVAKRWEARPSDTDIVVIPGDSTNPGDKVWVSEGAGLAQLIPTSGVTDFPLDESFADGLALGADSGLWSTDAQGNRLRRMTFDGRLSGVINLPTGTGPSRIIRGPDQALWFIEGGMGMIGRFSTKDHSITHYPLPTPNALPCALTVGSDNYIWFTESSSHKVGRLIPDPIVP